MISEEGKIVFYAQKKYRNAGSNSISVRFSDESPNKIEEICSLSTEERNAIGQKSREFVLKEKGSAMQIRKVLDVIENIQI